MAEKPLAPGSTIGILGGGQLGRMLAMAAARLGLNCHIYCDEPRAPAYDVSARKTIAPYDDEKALLEFANAVDVATVEFENVPADALATVGKAAPVYPPPRALEVSQDRFLEKTYARDLGIAVAPFHDIRSLEDLETAADALGRPALLKTRRLGYDGKGQVRITDRTCLEQAYASLEGAPALLESYLRFECEISVLVVRGLDGEIRFYDPSENAHNNQILSAARVPARIPPSIAAAALDIGARLAETLDYRGVLCVEMFYCGERTETPLIVNEIAPRVHNSGHWTLDACAVSQFENHVRAVAGWPLGSCERHSDAVMTNLLGEDVKRWREIAGEANACLHLYGKREMRPGRKMGHVTRLKRKRARSSRLSVKNRKLL